LWIVFARFSVRSKIDGVPEVVKGMLSEPVASFDIELLSVMEFKSG
jgi:hypothetical protein